MKFLFVFFDSASIAVIRLLCVILPVDGQNGTVGASHAAELGFVWLGGDGWTPGCNMLHPGKDGIVSGKNGYLMVYLMVFNGYISKHLLWYLMVVNGD